MFELIQAKKYYGARYVTGWVALVNGQPRHFGGFNAKKEAREYLHAQELYVLRLLLKEWVDDEVERPFFHEDEHGPESLLHRSRKLLSE